MKIHQSVHCCRFTFNVSPQIDTFISRMDWIQESRTGLMDITSRYSMDKNMEVSTGDLVTMAFNTGRSSHGSSHTNKASTLVLLRKALLHLSWRQFQHGIHGILCSPRFVNISHPHAVGTACDQHVFKHVRCNP